MLKVLDLFSGIGGFSLGLERTGGFETIAFCEIDKFCQKVLKKHWPDVPIYEDIKELDGKSIKADVITGGFPCQDISIAGNQAGIGGSRSGLWSELCRIISEVRPQYAIVENVTALLSGDRGRWFGRVLGDLAEIGYDTEWHCIPASAIGAPHRRDRIWIIAYPRRKQWSLPLLSRHDVTEAKRRSTTVWRKNREFSQMASVGYEIYLKRMDKSKSARVDDGIPDWIYRLKACGNSVVPQIPELIGRAILNYD